MATYVGRLNALRQRIAAYPTPNDGRKSDGFVALLKDVASIVREAESSSAPNLAEVVNTAGNIFDSAVDRAYNDGDGDDSYDFLPSYAHGPGMPLIKDPMQRAVQAGAARELLQMLEGMLFGKGGAPNKKLNEILPCPWPESPHPHPKSTRLSRFREGVNISATDVTPLARTILQARCEVSADMIACPIGAAVSSDSSVLAVIGQCGYKHRDPYLSLHFLNEGTAGQAAANAGDDDEEEFGYQGKYYTTMPINEPGFSEVAYSLALDTSRKLAVVADSYRIKTFFWGRSGDVTFDNWTPERGTNVHTLNSTSHDDGPVVVLPGGRIARGGKGGFAIWNLDNLATHKGGKRVGKGKYNIEDTWRDDSDEIERSTGSMPSRKIKFTQSDAQFAPAAVGLHEPTGHLLAGENSRKTQGHYGCYALDLEHDGRKVTRFLGHGGNVEAFSVSTGDANVFATGCSDGYARLFDMRRPLPVMTLDSGGLNEFCSTVLLVHPDGVPVLFTAGTRSQSIKTWDIRAKAIPYELATGNNEVHALSWDAKRTALYATTECDSMDRLGYYHGYRRARIPRWAQRVPEEVDPGMDVDDDDDEYDSEDDDSEENWPERAYHDESFFGYAYDAGDHVLLRYGFKEDPDVREIPEYGRGELERDNYW